MRHARKRKLPPARRVAQLRCLRHSVRDGVAHTYASCARVETAPVKHTAVVAPRPLYPSAGWCVATLGPSVKRPYVRQMFDCPQSLERPSKKLRPGITRSAPLGGTSLQRRLHPRVDRRIDIQNLAKRDAQLAGIGGRNVVTATRAARRPGETFCPIASPLMRH